VIDHLDVHDGLDQLVIRAAFRARLDVHQPDLKKKMCCRKQIFHDSAVFQDQLVNRVLLDNVLRDHQALRQEHDTTTLLDVGCGDHTTVILREEFHSDVVGQCSLGKALLFEFMILFAIEMTFGNCSEFVLDFFDLGHKLLELCIFRKFIYQFHSLIWFISKYIRFSKPK
jgi:hypothetical protein